VGLIVTTVYFGVLIVMLAVVLAVVTLIIYTVGVLDYPFDSRLQVGPDAFEQVLGSTQESSS
jgi:uncharacterized protein YybS (DUF2232 family)